MNTTFGVGKVLGTGFRVWFRNLIPFLLLTALFCAPPWLWAAIAVHGASTPEAFQRASSALGFAGLASVLLNVLASASLTYGVIMDLHGTRASVWSCITTGLSRFLPSLAVAVLAWLCIGFGTLLFVIPGVILYCYLYVAMPVAVIERRGILGALGRSGELTRGHKLQIFGLCFVLGAIMMFGFFVVSMIVGGVAGAMYVRDGAAVDPTPALSFAVYFNCALQVITGSLMAVMISVAYYYLRAEKEGTSAAELAAIFD